MSRDVIRQFSQQRLQRRVLQIEKYRPGQRRGAIRQSDVDIRPLCDELIGGLDIVAFDGVDQGVVGPCPAQRNGIESMRSMSTITKPWPMPPPIFSAAVQSIS